MADYQNLFTTVTATGPVHHGVELPHGDSPRTGKPFLLYWAGKLGNAQIGPIYLGWTGIASLIFGFLWFEIVGLNMLASVGWNPIQFVRQLPWLALEPPGPQYGFTPFVPLAEGGWWILAGFCLTISILLWWVRTYRRARALGWPVWPDADDDRAGPLAGLAVALLHQGSQRRGAGKLRQYGVPLPTSHSPAIMPPTVAPGPKCGGSNARHWPFSANAASSSASGVPQRAVTTSSLGS